MVGLRHPACPTTVAARHSLLLPFPGAAAAAGAGAEAVGAAEVAARVSARGGGAVCGPPRAGAWMLQAQAQADAPEMVVGGVAEAAAGEAAAFWGFPVAAAAPSELAVHLGWKSSVGG